jgi:RNA polymerase sigma-70 factor, ECF subfamily
VANQEPDDSRGKAATLGDLLYADRARSRVDEKVWVQLLASIAGRDQLALRELYQRIHRVVFTLIMRIVHNRETAEEVTLDVFHDVWRRASSYDASAGTVVGWIMNQARSRAIDRLRFEQRKKRVNPGIPVDQHDQPRSDEIASVGVEGPRLRDALNVLTPEERVAIETAYFSELTYAETAAQLNEPIGTVKTRIRSGLAKLRQVVDKP